MNILELLIISVGILTAVGIISSISPSTKQDTYVIDRNMNMAQFTTSFLRKQFLECYGYYDNRKSQYVLTGTDIVLFCSYDEDTGRLTVIYVSEVTADKRNFNIKRGFKIQGKFVFHASHSLSSIPVTDNPKLVVMFNNHLVDDQLYRNREEKFEEMFSLWEQGLKESIESEKNSAATLTYYDDNKAHANILSNDLNAIKGQFSAVKEIFESQFSNVELAEGINTLQQELLTIDKIERTFVQFIRLSINVFVSSNGIDIDITTVNGKQKEILDQFKDEIVRQINQRMVLREHFKPLHVRQAYTCMPLKTVAEYQEKIKRYYYLPNKTAIEKEAIESLILSTRLLMDGEKDIIIQYLAESVRTIELMVDNIDDWAFSPRFVDDLLGIIGKAKLQISYSRSRDIENAKRRFKRGGDFDIKFIQKESGHCICWQLGGYRVYGLPERKRVIDDKTYATVMKYYLEKTNR